jgi:uncharacterized OsmC-like protein
LLFGEITGEVEAEDDGVIVIKRIHAKYHLKVEASVDRDKIQRAFDNHMPKCPVYRSISSSIDITSELVVEEV